MESIRSSAIQFMRGSDTHALGAKPIDRTFGWSPEIVALALVWGALYFASASSKAGDGAIAAVVLIVLAGAVLGVRMLQRKHRLSVLIVPEKNYAAIYSNGKLSKQTTLSSLGIVIQDAVYTIGPAVAALAGVIVFTTLALPGGAKTGLDRLFAGGTAILCAALLIERLRTRLLYRTCILPKARMLIPKPDAQQLGLELGLHIIRDMAVTNTRDAHWQRTLSLNLVKVGDLRCARGDRSGALAAYEESLSITQKAATADPANPDLQREIETVREKIRRMRTSQEAG